MDRDMRDYLENAIGISEEQDLGIDQIIVQMQHHYRKKSNIAVDRVAFLNRK